MSNIATTTALGPEARPVIDERELLAALLVADRRIEAGEDHAAAIEVYGASIWDAYGR